MLPEDKHLTAAQVVIRLSALSTTLWFARLLRELPLGRQRITRTASAPAVSDFTFQDSPCQISMETISANGAMQRSDGASFTLALQVDHLIPW